MQDKIAIWIDGGIGKQICFTSCLEELNKYYKKIYIVSGYPEIYNLNPHVYRNFNFNHQYLYEDYLNFILTLSKAISNYPELSVEKFEIDQGYRSVNVKFVNGPMVYFNTKLDAAEQLNRLILVKKEKIKDNFSKVNYIDLRYGDRLFIN